MARTVVTAIAVPSAYADVSAEVTWTASDTGNKNRTPLTGREVVLVRCTGGTHGATITSSPDEMGRTNDVVVSLGPNEQDVFPLFKAEGWVQADGHLWFEGDHGNIEWAILRLP